MKSKKGFTLTEILGVIAILGLLLLLIVPTILNRVRTSESDTKQAQDKMIEESANLYMDDNKDLFPNTTDNVYCIPVQTLIDNGKITEELKDVTAKDENIKKRVIKVTISKNGNRIFENVDSCNEIQYKNIVFTVGPKDNSVWTTSKYVTIKYPDMGEGYVNKYSVDGGKTWKVVVGNSKKTEDFTADGKVMARMEGPTVIKDEYPVKRIDRTAPTITSVTGNPTSWTKNSVTLTVNGAKDSQSGLAASAYSFDNGATWQTSNQKTYTANTSNIIVKVRDAVGNIYTHSAINITKIDKTAPTITSVTGNPTSWTKNNVTLTINGAKDSQSGLAASAYSFDNGATWQTSNQKTYTANTSNIIVKVRDAVGNIYTHSAINITKIDKTAPTITSVTGNPTSWTKNNVTLTINGAKDSQSGLAASAYSFDNGATWQTSNQKTYTANTSNIIVKVRDAVGNIYTRSAINITKIDKTPPNAPYIGSLWLGGDLNVTGNSCSNVGGGQANAVCDVYISTGHYSTWWFDSSYSHSDAGGSGISYNQNYWTHNGSSSDYYPDWSTSCCGNWAADSGSYNYATWITWGLRSVDNVGNVGYTTTVRFHISYW